MYTPSCRLKAWKTLVSHPPSLLQRLKYLVVVSVQQQLACAQVPSQPSFPPGSQPSGWCCLSAGWIFLTSIH